MTPLSSDPEKRKVQLANLRRGGTTTGGRPAVHGARARMTRAELDGKTAEIFEALAEDAPIRDGDSLPNADAPAVRMLAETLARLDRVTEYLDRRGWQDAKGEPRNATVYEDRLRGRALELMRELGMTPAARLKLGVELVRAQAVRAAAEDAEVQREARERLDQRLADIDADAEEVSE